MTIVRYFITKPFGAGMLLGQHSNLKHFIPKSTIPLAQQKISSVASS
jgi:hypothetical protein